MKTSNIRVLLIGLIFTAGVFYLSGCDKIEAPYTKEILIADTATCPPPEFPAITAVQKRVLLEEYTGQKCPNCPLAAVVAHDLKETHGEKLILLSVHAGFFAEPTLTGNFAHDYRSEAGTTWFEFFNIVYNPRGMVNRIGFPENTHVIPKDVWATKIAEALGTDPLVDLQLINDYDATERKLCTHVKTNFITNIDKDLKLIVVLTESGIISPQQNTDTEAGETPTIFEYEHNHMLRNAISSPWGYAIATSGIPNPASLVKSFKYIVPDNYVADNCTVVAFVYDDATKEILQAVEVPVTE